MAEIYSSKKYGVFSQEALSEDLSLAEYAICDKVEKDINGLLGTIYNVFNTNAIYVSNIETEMDVAIYKSPADLDYQIEMIKRNWKDLNLELSEGKKVSSKFISELKRIYLTNSSLQVDQDFLKLLDLLEVEELYSLKKVPKKFIVRYANSIFKSVIEKMRNMFPYSEFVIAFNIVLIKFNLEQGSVADNIEKLNTLKTFTDDGCSYLTERMELLFDNYDSARENAHVDENGVFLEDWIYETGIVVTSDIDKVLKIAWPMINNTWTEIQSATGFRNYLLAGMPYLNTQDIDIS